ncbi:MAG TPA: M14 family metallopeptidase [Steroidobacteraceae bacterium]|nr:M14 family metallopeptidase [Steroidobacteraceae bacterium]
MSRTFAADYVAAREKFLAAAKDAKAELATFVHPEAGPEGESLSTDVAWLGSANAKRVFVIVSGTHGVEGICGSDAQVAWLRKGEFASFQRAEIAVMLIHAINPYGFAWLRRVTHENVDLNRNWIDFDGLLPDSAAYAEVADLLSPTAWDDAAKLQIKGGIQAFVAKRGPAALIQAVSGGQHSHPQGLFYGGTGPTWSRVTLSKILAERLATAEHVGLVDLHSGLGASGVGEIMVTADANAPSYLRARHWYGAAVTPVGTAASSSAKIGGDWIGAVPALLSHCEVTGMALEFGTVDVMAVLFALIGDHYLHARGDLRSDEAQSIKRDIRRAFYTDDDTWRGMVIGQVFAASRSAARALSGF